MSTTSSVAPLTFSNAEFKACDPTQPNPVDCIMVQQIGSPNGVVVRPHKQQTLANQSWPAEFKNGQLAAWHAPWSGYFNSEQQVECNANNQRAGIDNVCWTMTNVPPATLSAPFSKNPGPYNMDNGQYLFQLTQAVPPLTGMSTADVLVRDRE